MVSLACQYSAINCQLIARRGGCGGFHLHFVASMYQCTNVPMYQCVHNILSLILSVQIVVHGYNGGAIKWLLFFFCHPFALFNRTTNVCLIFVFFQAICHAFCHTGTMRYSGKFKFLFGRKNIKYIICEYDQIVYIKFIIYTCSCGFDIKN